MRTPLNLRDYFLGRPVVLRSPLSPEAVSERIKANAKRWFHAPWYTGPAGGVMFGRLTLRWVSSALEYNAKPILVGTIGEAGIGSTLNLTYRGPTMGRLFLILWYAIFALFGFMVALNGTDPSLQGGDRLFVAMMSVVLVAFPIGLHLWGTRNSDQELEDLIEFLGDVAETHWEE